MDPVSSKAQPPVVSASSGPSGCSKAHKGKSKGPSDAKIYDNLMGRREELCKELRSIDAQLRKTAMPLSGDARGIVPDYLRPTAASQLEFENICKRNDAWPEQAFIPNSISKNMTNELQALRTALKDGNYPLAMSLTSDLIDHVPPGIHRYDEGEKLCWHPIDIEQRENADKLLQSARQFAGEIRALDNLIVKFHESIKPGGAEFVTPGNREKLESFKKDFERLLERSKTLDSDLEEHAATIQKRIEYIHFGGSEPSENSQGSLHRKSVLTVLDYQTRKGMVQAEQQQRQTKETDLTNAREGLQKATNGLMTHFDEVDQFVNPKDGWADSLRKGTWWLVTSFTGSTDHGLPSSELGEKAEAI